jgi:hypothetical protein
MIVALAVSAVGVRFFISLWFSKPFLTAFLLVLASMASLAQTNDVFVQRHWNRWRLGYERVKLPGDERMGLASVHYDLLGPIESAPGLYLGFGGYGAVDGHRGGLFVWGPSAGWRQEIYRGLALDAGLFAGGGGGAGAPQGGGLMLRPHFGVEQEFGPVNLCLGISHVRFPSGSIDSTDFFVGLTIPVGSYTARRARMQEQLGAWEWFATQSRVGPAFMSYFPSSSARNRSGTALANHVDLVGVSYQRSIGENLFLPLEAYGAFNGDAAGYMTVMSGLGWHQELAPRWWLDTEMLVGAGGGGDVDTGGGLLLQPMVGLGARLTRHWTARIMGGYTWSPQGQFSAPTVQAMLFWDTRGIGPIGNPPPESGVISGKRVEIDDWMVTLGNKTYLPRGGARYRDGSVQTEGVNLISAGVEKPLTDWLSVTGRGASAWQGRVGGYSEGLIGGRICAPPATFFGEHTFSLHLEAGAGGGGGMDAGGGLIAQGTVGWRWKLWEGLALNAAVGRMGATGGSFKADVVEGGLIWSFGRARAR